VDIWAAIGIVAGCRETRSPTGQHDVRLELRRQMQLLQAQGKTHVEIAEITGYTRTYVSTMLKRLVSERRCSRACRAGASTGQPAALSAKEERRAQALICGKCPDQLSMRLRCDAGGDPGADPQGVRHPAVDSRRGEYLARWGYTPQKAAGAPTSATMRR